MESQKRKGKRKNILETKIEIIEEELNNEKVELKENEDKKNELLRQIEKAKNHYQTKI